MESNHDFRIPDNEYVVCHENLFCYLADKIGNGNICLVCNLSGKAFYSLQVIITKNIFFDFAEIFFFEIFDFFEFYAQCLLIG